MVTLHVPVPGQVVCEPSTICQPMNPGPLAVSTTIEPDGKYCVQILIVTVQLTPAGAAVTKSAAFVEKRSITSATPLLITFVDTGPELLPPVTVAPAFVSVPSAAGTIVMSNSKICPGVSVAILQVIEFVPVQPVDSVVALKFPGR